MTKAERDAFIERVKKRAFGFEQAGQPVTRAVWKALEYELEQLANEREDTQCHTLDDCNRATGR